MVHLQGVTRRYRVGGQVVDALAGIDVEVPQGQFVAIVGPSGSGKSTLLNILGCLDRPTAGSYSLDGTDVSTFDDERASDFRNRRVGFVFQSCHLLPRLTVLENVLLPQRFLRSSPTTLEPRARTLLERMGLGERLQHRPEELSGGQMQRVAIARALLMQPALLLADEPTGNLDSHTGGEIIELLKSLRGEKKMTLAIATHDESVAAHAERVVQLVDGQIQS
jgi:putative ABC transport system ATP-binding protein